MISENLYNILEGNYYIKERKYFVVDPKSFLLQEFIQDMTEDSEKQNYHLHYMFMQTIVTNWRR